MKLFPFGQSCAALEHAQSLASRYDLVCLVNLAAILS